MKVWCAHFESATRFDGHDNWFRLFSSFDKAVNHLLEVWDAYKDDEYFNYEQENSIDDSDSPYFSLGSSCCGSDWISGCIYEIEVE